MITSLSKYRLEHCSKEIKHFGRSFVILKSIKDQVVTQFYIVPTDWKKSSRVEPLAHINSIRGKGLVFKTWQPDTYLVSFSKEKVVQAIT